MKAEKNLTTERSVLINADAKRNCEAFGKTIETLPVTSTTESLSGSNHFAVGRKVDVTFKNTEEYKLTRSC